MRDTSLSPKERGDKFLPWVSSYFSAVSSLSEVTPAFLAARSALPDDTFRPTVKGMSAPELASTTHFGALASNLALRQIDPAIYARNLRRALVDTGDVWQNVKALVVWCDMSVVDCIWGAKACADLVAEKHGVGHIQRAIEFIKIEGANHFVSLHTYTAGHERSYLYVTGPLGSAREAAKCLVEAYLTKVVRV